MLFSLECLQYGSMPTIRSITQSYFEKKKRKRYLKKLNIVTKVICDGFLL